MTTDRLQICLPGIKMILPRDRVETALAPSTSVALNSYQSVPFCSEPALLPDGSAYADQLQAWFSSASSSYSLHPYLGMSIASSSLFSSTMIIGSWVSRCPFTIFSPHWRMVITKSTAPKTLQSSSKKIPPTYYALI